MHTDKDGKTHMSSDEARAGRSPGHMRYILGISTVLAIICLTGIYVYFANG